MKESTQIALTFAKAYLSKIQKDNVTLQTGHIHLHVPEVLHSIFISLSMLTHSSLLALNGKSGRRN